eukprot:11219919-Lingulodinium_polyedra.AAC.1
MVSQWPTPRGQHVEAPARNTKDLVNNVTKQMPLGQAEHRRGVVHRGTRGKHAYECKHKH